MSDVIVDTNVAVVANRQNSNVVDGCVDACILFLSKVRTDHVVLIDSGDEIRAEYAKALRVSRPFGLGALFLRHIFNHQYNPERVRRVDLRKGEHGDFVDFPIVPELVGFDRDDWKFAALAKNTGAAVSNAIDSDWADHLAALKTNGVAVDFLCGCNKSRWFK